MQGARAQDARVHTRVEECRLQPKVCEAIAVGLGDSLDQAMQAQASQLVAHAPRADFAGMQPLMKAVRRHIKEDWILLHIDRWLTAPFETADRTQLPRARGVPQGGVVSPILVNLSMHYAFDLWMERTCPHSPFARNADDAVVHCRGPAQAE
jgi:hypothetical protein